MQLNHCHTQVPIIFNIDEAVARDFGRLEVNKNVSPK